MGLWENRGGRTGQIYRLHDFVCLWSEHEKKLLFLHCIPRSFSTTCPPPVLCVTGNGFQMGWCCPHGEDVVVRLDPFKHALSDESGRG